MEGGSPDRLVELCDRTTTEDLAVLVGRINIYEASRPVLAAIPGLTNEQVERIVTARQTTPVDAKRAHVVWLLVEGVVDRPTMDRIWPYVTMGGDVQQAQVVAMYDDHSPWMRCEVMIDGTINPPPMRSYRDLRRSGSNFRLKQLIQPASASETSPRGSATENQSPPWKRTADGDVHS
jgi:hypothetical protein